MSPTKLNGSPEWTMMVFLAGDNNLSEEMVWALQEMRKTLVSGKLKRDGETLRFRDVVRVVAQLDASGTSPKLFPLNERSFEEESPAGVPVEDEEEDLVKFRSESLLSGFIRSVKATPEQIAIARLHLRTHALSPVLAALPGPVPTAKGGGSGESRTSLMISILTRAIELEKYKPAEKFAEMKKWLEQLDADIRELGSPGLPPVVLNCWEEESPIWSDDSPAEEALAELIARAPREIANSVQAQSFEGFVKREVKIAVPDGYQGNQGRHMIVLSGHGSGAIGDFLPDSDPPGSLSIPRLGHFLRLAVEESKKTKLVSPDCKIAMLGMDSCMMSMVEVCAEIKDSVEVLIGSEGFVANAGWPYHRVVQKLAKAGPQASVQTVAKSIVDVYTSFYRSYELAGASTQIAAIDLGKYAGLEEELRALVARFLSVLEAPFSEPAAAWGTKREAASQKMPEYAFGVKNAKARRLLTAILTAHWRSQTYKLGQYVDIWDFCSNLTQELDAQEFGEILEKVSEVKKRIEGRNGTVIASNYCGAEFQHSHGLSIYFPWALDDLSPEYRNLEFDKRTEWFRFLEAFLTLTQRERRGEGNLGKDEVPIPFDHGSDSEMIVEELLLSPGQGRRRARQKAKDGLHAAVRTGLHAAVRTGLHAAVRGGHHGDIRSGAGSSGKSGLHADSRGMMAGGSFETIFQNSPRGYYRRFVDNSGTEVFEGEEAL